MTTPTFNIDEAWASEPMTRAEGYMLLSKMQRLIILHSQFRMAVDAKNAVTAKQFSDEITKLSGELSDALNALVKMPVSGQ